MADTSSATEKAAIKLLFRAVELDKTNRYTASLTCYLEGLELFMEAIKDIVDENKAAIFRQKAASYLTRAEQIKHLIAELKKKGNYHEHFEIEDGDIGYSYNSIMGRLLNAEVSSVQIDDPYVKKNHQLMNLVRLCELFVNKCPDLKEISLTTSNDADPDQEKRFGELAYSLRQRNISLKVTRNSNLHDRHIKLSSGWIIKIGRGLDFYKPISSNMHIGYFDYDLRPCNKTSVDIFFSKS